MIQANSQFIFSLFCMETVHFIISPLFSKKKVMREEEKCELKVMKIEGSVHTGIDWKLCSETRRLFPFSSVCLEMSE